MQKILIFLCQCILFKYSDNCSIPSGSLWNYCRDEVNDVANENDAANDKINNNKATTGKSFEYETKLIGSTPNNNSRLKAELFVALKYLSSSWKSLDLSLINC